MTGFSPYIGIFRTRFRALLQYRAAAAAGIATQVLFGWVRVMLLAAFYQHGGPVQPMSLEQAITYTWIGQAMLGIMPWNIEPEIGQSVRTGQVAYELARPLDLYWMWYARCIALRTAPTLLRAVPQFILALWVFSPKYRMIFPQWNVFFGWAIATGGALLLSAAVTSLLNVSLFWTVSGEGIVRLLPILVLLLSGMSVPLPLLPDWLQTILRLQPFAGLVDGPARIFAGHIPLSELPQMIFLQLFWTTTLILLCRALMKRGLKQVVIAGG